jgi:ABC-type spermidine/putrescine transport system permease subunit II
MTEQKPVNPTSQAQRRYIVAMAVAMTVYVVVLCGALTLVGRFEPQGVLRYALLMAPLVPVAFVGVAVLRYFRETDEFERRIMTESLAIAAGVTAFLSVTYGFLENTGLPPLSAWYTWMVLMGSWLIARFFVAKVYR